MSAPDLRLLPLSPELLPAWLAFFDGPAFADNPEWGTCYCRCFVFGSPPEATMEAGMATWDAACAAGANRAPMIEKIQAGEVDGVLAFSGDEVVGWMHLGPAPRFCTAWGTTFGAKEGDDPRIGAEGQAAIVCFLVAAPHRGVGVGRAMLRAGLAELQRRGFRSVLALGAAEVEEGASHQFTGPLRLYLQEGFEVVRPSARRPLVWRALTWSS